MIKLTSSAIFLLFLVLTFVSTPLASERAAEVESYINLLASQGVSKRITALKKISNSAITDHRLYDMVAKQLKSLDIGPRAKENIDEVAWLCRALASSGDYKYQPAVKEVIRETTNKKIRSRARQSYLLFDEYKHRNEIVNDRSKYFDDLTEEENRLCRMISSGPILLKRDGAKMVFRKEGELHPRVYEVISDDLLAHYEYDQRNNKHVDTLAWLCKALASSGDGKYISTFEEIKLTTRNPKLRKFARKGIKALSSKRSRVTHLY